MGRRGGNPRYIPGTLQWPTYGHLPQPVPASAAPQIGSETETETGPRYVANRIRSSLLYGYHIRAISMQSPYDRKR